MESADRVASCGLDRRALLRRGLLLAWAAFNIGTPRARAAKTLSVAVQDWLLRLYPQLLSTDRPAAIEFADLNAFVRAAARHTSSADLYVGLTPFSELERLVEKRALAPWDAMPASVRSDIPDVVLREGTIDGKLYNWPFLLDVTILGWNADLVARAGLDPARPPETWDELITAARHVVRSGAAPYGCTFDPRPWRSLVPIAYSFDTHVYDDRGLFDFRSDAALAALQVLREMREVANPDIFRPAATSGPAVTPDEAAFGNGLAAYYVKYQNAHIRMAATWRDPGQLVLARLPRPPSGAGKTVFWTTGIGLLRYSTNIAQAARYAKAVTHDDAIWQAALGTGRASVGQLPVFPSIWRRWRRDPPPWLGDWAQVAWTQLVHAEPIRPSRLGAGQFLVCRPPLDAYLAGEERSARRALDRAAALVRSAAG